MKPLKLKAIDRPGAGWEIQGYMPETIDCAEFVMKASYQPIAQCNDGVLKLHIANEPWIQFPPEKWRKMIGKIFIEMVELWNEKHEKKEKQ